MSTLVTFDEVSKSYGDDPVLLKISFELNASEHHAVTGPSGCGKSTLLSLLAGLMEPDEGTIAISGKPVSEAGKILRPAHMRTLSMVFQDLALWPNLNVLQNVVMGIQREDVLNRSGRIARARAMLQLTGIEPLLARKPGGLSAGQQQRVAIARALAARPRMLLLDEPFTGLDLPLKQQIVGEIREWAAQFGITLILISHDLWEIRTLCDRALVIEDHKIAEQGDLEELLKAPSSVSMRALALSLIQSG